MRDCSSKIHTANNIAEYARVMNPWRTWLAAARRWRLWCP